MPQESTNREDKATPDTFRRGRFLPSRALLYRLFFEPQVLLSLRADGWQRPFRMICIMCALSGIIIGFARAPHILKASQEWATWFQKNVQVLRLEDDSIHWKNPRELPNTAWHKDWRVSFNPPEASFDPRELEEQKNVEQGIWISPSAVYTWWRSADGSVHPVTLFKDGKLRDAMKADEIWKEGLVLQGDGFSKFARTFAIILIPALMIQKAFLLFITVIFYTTIFAIIPFVMRNPFWFDRGFSSALGFYLYAAIPPFIATVVFQCLRLNALGMSGIFVLCFVAYLFLAFYNMRKNLTQERP